MAVQPIRLLLVEDDPGHALLVKEMVRLDPRIEMDHADCLGTALEHLGNEPHDVVLLDLGLPDSVGVDTIRRVLGEYPLMPIVVLSGYDDESTAIEAIKNGAQDYLVKMRTDGELLARTLRHAIERRELLRELELARRAQTEELEQQRFDQLAERPEPPEVDTLELEHPLRQRKASVFQILADRYRELIGLAIEQRTNSIDEDIPSMLNILAADLIGQQADGRDAMDLHRAAMLGLLDADREMRSAYAEEGRFLLLELMGQLVTHYRGLYLGNEGLPRG